MKYLKRYENLFGEKYKEAADSFMYIGQDEHEQEQEKVYYNYKHGITRRNLVDDDGNRDKKLALSVNPNHIVQDVEFLKLVEKYPEIKFTFDKKGNGYSVRADIKTQGDEYVYLGAIKGVVSKEEGLKYLKDIAEKNYDKYY